MQEIWKSIPGFERLYAVSNLGNIKTFARPGSWRTRLLKPNINKNGYRRVCLRKNKQIFYKTVPSLILLAFKGMRPEGMQVCHNDGIRDNDVLWNLRYDTPKGNSNDKYKHNTMIMGEAVKISKLNKLQVRIIASLKNEIEAEWLADVFNVHTKTIWNIFSGKCWKHLTGLRGTKTKGENNFQAKLIEKDIIEIRKSNDTGRYLAGKYGVSTASISLIKNRKAWKHI